MNDAPSPLGPSAVAPFLRATIATLTTEVNALAPHALAWHPAPGEWCVKEVLGHLIETERRGFAGRIRIILDSQEPKLESWDQNAVAAARRDCERDGRALLGELAAMREDSARLVEGLGAADLARGGHHPAVGHLRVGDLLNEWIHHDRNHVRQILANVQAYVWPHMGNARKFSAG
jgi:DinB family protein